MSRRTILQEKGYTLDYIVRAYRKTHNLRIAAKQLGIDVRTLRKYLDRAGINRRPGRRFGTEAPNKDYHHGCFANWLRKNKDLALKLPRDIKAIASLSGCTYNEVKSYLYRRRQLIRKRVSAWKITEWPGGMPDENGTYIPFQAWKSYKILSVDTYTFELVVRATLRTGQERYFRGQVNTFLVNKNNGIFIAHEPVTEEPRED